MKLHIETISIEMLELLKKLMTIEELNPFRLVGGTALSLQFGHRKSVDIDLFAGGRTETGGLLSVLGEHFNNSFELISQNRNGFVGQINQIKVDIVDWKVPFTQEPLVEDGIRMATAPDIFASKCDALLDRKAEKDFVDISMIAAHYDLAQLFITLKTRYPFITTGSISAFLLRQDLIVRDYTMHYFQHYNFEYFAHHIQNKLIEFEKSVKEKKQLEAGDREKKIQNLIEQKRKKSKS